jgi:exportin-T
LTAKARRSAKKTGLEVFDRDLLQALLQTIFKKLRYDDYDDAQSTKHIDSEEEAEFQDLRKRLLSFQDTIGTIDPDLYSQSISTLVMSTLQALNLGQGNNWRDTEVALLEMHTFAEPLKGDLRFLGQAADCKEMGSGIVVNISKFFSGCCHN